MELVRGWRKCLRRPRLWGAAGLALALTCLPFLVDRAQEWASLRRASASAGRGDADAARLRAVAGSYDMGALRPEAEAYYRLANPGACEERPGPFLVGFVASRTGQFAGRQAIRHSWASVAEVDGRGLLVLFALGLPETDEEQERIREESASHGDLVQGTFADTYHNLTLKTLMILRWFGTYCPAASYLLKVDDDVFLNPRSLVGHLIGLGRGSEDLYLGWVHRRVRPVRDKSDLYYVSEEVYPGEVYPDYCSGTSYVVSRDVARKVYVAALSTPLVAIEDVFVGLCARRAGVSPTHTSRMSGPVRFHLNRCCYRSIFASHHVRPGEFPAIWRLVNEGGACSTLASLAGLFACKALALLSPVINQ